MNRKTHNHQNKYYSHRGQSLIELALTLPILLLLIVGAMDFARMFSTKIVLTNTAREGANYITRNPAKIANTGTVINNEAQNLIFDSVFYDCSPKDDDGCIQGGTATVTLTKNVNLIFGGFLQTFGTTGGPIELSSTVEMMVQ